jgi:hypothetical protein
VGLLSSIAVGYRLDDQGFKSQQRLKIFLFTIMSRPALRPTQSTIQWVPRGLSLGIKWLGHEADHSNPSNVNVKNVCSYTSIPQYALMAWCLVKKLHGQTLHLPLKHLLLIANSPPCLSLGNIFKIILTEKNEFCPLQENSFYSYLMKKTI